MKAGPVSEQEDRHRVLDLCATRIQELRCDILPFIFQMITPQDLNETNFEVWKDSEKQQFYAALEMMILFDMRLLPPV